MFLIPAYLLFKILKRFPLIVFIIYSANTFAFATTETEENIEETEYLHSSLSINLNHLKLNNDVLLIENTTWTRPQMCESTKSGFITTERKKIYLLYSQLKLNHSEFDRGTNNKLNKNINIQNIKYYEQSIKINGRQSSSNHFDLLYSNHNYCNYSL